MSQFRTSRIGRLPGRPVGRPRPGDGVMAGGFASTASAAEPIEVAHTATNETMTAKIVGSTANGPPSPGRSHR